MLRKDPANNDKLLVPANKQTAKSVHVYGMMVVAVCVVLGFSAIYANKAIKGSSHFTSWHGKFGLATLIVVLVQVVLGLPIGFNQIGFMVYGRQGFIKKLKLSRQIHAVGGCLVVVCSAVALSLGFWLTVWFWFRFTTGMGLRFWLRARRRSRKST